ncbi:nuclear transport factor 2 family protein [Mycobacteroides chelonae]|uniref:nuclear transport factor 2 family protein n=1 Tax=Mycobacteroides chelonae TaxID=1774 RepID=UPI000991D7E6|nr:nuclear transport factor 2 family protein [Mycobacteroides chelonae]QQG98245.1 nuclear transport factor 2 family protein [Mycobacteroides chelonae]
MAVIDTERTWELVEKRLAATTNERHRVVLGAVLHHMRLERDADLDGLIDTLSANPNYHFWMDGQDFGPKGRDGVRTYYEGLVQGRMSVMEFEMDRLLVDDNCVVTEGFLKQIYPGAVAQSMGFPIEDPGADYLLVFRQLVLWPVDADGFIEGEDSYHSGPVSITKLAPDELPQEYRELTGASSAL